MGGGMDNGMMPTHQAPPQPPPQTATSEVPEEKPDILTLSRSNLQRIRSFRSQRIASVGEGLDASSSHSKGPAITWRRHETKRLGSLAESKEMDENLPSPVSGRIRITREYGTGSATRTLTRLGTSGTSKRSLLARGSTGASMRGLTTTTTSRDRDGGSKRSLMQNSRAQSMRSFTWTRNGGGEPLSTQRSSRTLARNSTTPTKSRGTDTAARIREERILSQSEHGTITPTKSRGTGSGGTAARIREERSLSRSEHNGRGRRRAPVGLSEHLRTSNNSSKTSTASSAHHHHHHHLMRASNHSTSGASVASSKSGESTIDHIPENSNVKDTTLELLALIKRRRKARAKRDGGDDRRASLSPVPARKTKPARRRSSSFSPDKARKRLEMKKVEQEKSSRSPFSPVGDRKRLSDQVGKRLSRSPFSPRGSGGPRKRLSVSDQIEEKLGRSPFSPRGSGGGGRNKRLSDQIGDKLSRSPFSPSAGRKRLGQQIGQNISRAPFSPGESLGRRKRLGKKKAASVRSMSLPVDEDHLSSSRTTKATTDVLRHSTHSIPRKRLPASTPLSSSNHSLRSFNTDGGNSFDSFGDEEEEKFPVKPPVPAKSVLSDEGDSDDDSDEESHHSPKGVMEFPHVSKDKTATQEKIDSIAHQEKMNRMRAEMEELQEQLGRMEQDKAKDIQDLKDDVDARKHEMMENAKKKIRSHLESEMELRIYTMEVEQARLDKMKEVLEKGKMELKEDLAEVQGDMQELSKENKRLDAENKEVHRMYTHLSKWITKKTEQNKKLGLAEEKLKKIYSGSLALVVEEKLSALYRRAIYRVAQGVNSCEGFDFELNEEVLDMIKEVEEECNKEVIDLYDIDELDEEIAEKGSPLEGLRVSAGLDDIEEEDDDDQYEVSIRTRSTLGSLDLSMRSRISRDSSSYLTDEEEEESEREDSEFDEDMERLNDSVVFYEDVLAKVSVNLDAAQMNTLNENKDMLVSIFKFMDVDGSGDIDLEEFKVGIELLNKRLPASSHFEDAEELFTLLDVDSSGTIDLEEFERIFDDNE